MFKIPKNDSKYYWTQHVIRKMAYYGLTPDRIKRIIRNPKRFEDGIAENTIGAMQPRKIVSRSRGKPGTKNEEIWVMYQNKLKITNEKLKIRNSDSKFEIRNSKFIIISAWRYPGISPVGKQIPIPEDILEELKKTN